MAGAIARAWMDRTMNDKPDYDRIAITLEPDAYVVKPRGKAILAAAIRMP